LTWVSLSPDFMGRFLSYRTMAYPWPGFSRRASYARCGTTLPVHLFGFIRPPVAYK
jgi:hypothetical protein